MKYAFPILTSDGKEFTDAKALNGLLKGESGGHYLLGGHDKWHGGIHISEQTAPWCRDKHPVRCIADGKVVAFRILPDYLDSTFLGQTLKYSNCFCLVEHTYCETNPDTKTSNEFTFYSLYMHLLPWDHYQQGERLVLKANRNVRNSVPHLHPDPTQALSDKQLPTLTLPAGTEFLRVAGVPLKRGTLGKTDYDFALVKVLSAGKQSDKVLATQGCEVWLAMDEEAVTTIVPKLPNWLDDQIEAELTQAMTGRADPVPGETGQLPGAGEHHVSLPAGTQIRFDAHRLEFQLIDGQPRKMARCDFETSVQEGTSGLCGQAWVCVEDKFIKVLDQSASHLGTLYSLPNPVPIAAGDTIGYLGLVETPASLVETDAKRSIHQVHIEVFSQDPRLAEVLANKANTKGSASYARVPGGLPLAKQTKQDGKISFIPAEILSAEVLLDSPKQAKDNANIDWIEVQAGLFVQQSKVEMLSQHDWLKIGFQQIDGSGSDGHLAAEGPSPFFLELAKAIDPKREGELTSTDVRKILHDKSKATKIQKLIVKHPSEWYEKSAAPSYQWLEKLMAEVGLPEFDKLVDHEKQRIDSLEWMQSAKELKLGPDVWHLFPLSVIQKNIHSLAITYEQLHSIFPEASKTNLDIVLDEVNSNLERFKLNTRTRQRHFFSQIRGEVGVTMEGRTESWEYSPAVLRSFSSYYKANPQESEIDGYKKDSKGKIIRRADQQAIGRKHFQKLNGNRPSNPSDGFNFRGRGLIQITGYEKYNGFKSEYSSYWSGDVPDAVEQPNVINMMPTAIRSALWFWFKYKVYLCDNNNGFSDVPSVTKRVNGGSVGLDERKEAYKIIEAILK